MAREPHVSPSAIKIFALAVTLGLVLTANVFPAGRASSSGMSVLPVDLGSASTFSVLAATTSTNAATAAGWTATHLSGDLGVYPGTSLTGFAAVDSGPGIVDGVVDSPPYSRSAAAQSDAATAYLDAQGRASTILSGSTFQLGGHTYSPGVYSAGTSLDITGTLTLDGGGDPNAVFIFQAGSTLVTAAGSPSTPASTVALTHGTQAANVFWQVGSSATLGTYSSFSGTILALTSITATTGASIDGRLIALNAAVTLDSNNVSTSPADATAPTLTITGGAAITTTDTAPTITGTSDEIGATVTVTITDTTGNHTLTVVVDDNGDWTVTTLTDLTDGPHTVTAVVDDDAGNSTTTTQTITVDVTAPTLTITGGAAITTTDTAPTITGTSDEIGATVTVTITDTTGNHTLTVVVDDYGDWTVTTLTDLTEGPHTVTASVNDAAGNSASATEELTVSAPHSGGGSSGSDGRPDPTIGASGASPIDSPNTTPPLGEIRLLATFHLHGATGWIAPDSLGGDEDHELIPDRDEVHVNNYIPRGAQ